MEGLFIHQRRAQRNALPRPPESSLRSCDSGAGPGHAAIAFSLALLHAFFRRRAVVDPRQLHMCRRSRAAAVERPWNTNPISLFPDVGQFIVRPSSSHQPPAMPVTLAPQLGNPGTRSGSSRWICAGARMRPNDGHILSLRSSTSLRTMHALLRSTPHL